MGRLIAIGDIHGCSRALRALVHAISPTPDDTIVLVGDVIDRGPDSKGVLETLLELRGQCQLVPVRGNHEEMFIAATISSVDRRAWLHSGGSETLESYGPGGLEQVPAEHIDFVREFCPYYETERHMFLHANYEATLPLAQQPPRSLRWEFLHHRLPAPHFSGKTAVVGHSPQRGGEVLDLGYLICIETNVVGGGWLTALEVISGTTWQASREGKLRR